MIGDAATVGYTHPIGNAVADLEATFGWLCRCPVVVVVGEGTRRPAVPGARPAGPDQRDAGAAADPGGRWPRRLPRTRRAQHRRMEPVPAAEPPPAGQTTGGAGPGGG